MLLMVQNRQADLRYRAVYVPQRMYQRIGTLISNEREMHRKKTLEGKEEMEERSQLDNITFLEFYLLLQVPSFIFLISLNLKITFLIKSFIIKTILPLL